MNLENICRVCLEDSKKMYPLLGVVPNVDENISSMIKYCTLVEVTMEDGLPTGVCTPCFRTIRIAYNFIKQFKESNRQLLETKRRFDLQSLEEPKNIDENVEEIIIEYSKDVDYQGQIEDAEVSDQEFSIKEEEIHIYDDGYSPAINAAEEQSDEEYKNISEDEQNDEEYKNIPEEDENQDEYLEKRKLTQPFKCPVCGQSYKKFEVGFVKHLATHKDVKLKCDKCSLQTTLTIDLYIQHYRKAHRFQCYICNKSYGRRSGLCYHIKTHRGRKTYKCSYTDCDKSFLTAWCLRKHIHTHSKLAKYSCSKCDSEFKTYGSYKYHLKTHDGNRNYLCTSCGKTFLQLIHLKYHMWKHTGIKMFQCEECHKSYTSQTQLKRHKRKHCEVVPKTVGAT